MEGSAEQHNEKVYPGGIARYNEARAFRAWCEALDPTQENREAALKAAIVEELSGLAYILDGIRYSVRQNQAS